MLMLLILLVVVAALLVVVVVVCLVVAMVVLIAAALVVATAVTLEAVNGFQFPGKHVLEFHCEGSGSFIRLHVWIFRAGLRQRCEFHCEDCRNAWWAALATLATGPATPREVGVAVTPAAQEASACVVAAVRAAMLGHLALL